MYLAAVVEYLINEILEASVRLAKDKGNKSLTPFHLKRGITGDLELAKLCEGVDVARGGVLETFAWKRRAPPINKKGAKAAEQQQPE